MKLVVALLAATCRVDAFNVPAAPATPMGTVTRSAPAAMFFGAGAAKPAKTAKKGKPAAKKTVKKPVGALLPLSRSSACRKPVHPPLASSRHWHSTAPHRGQPHPTPSGDESPLKQLFSLEAVGGAQSGTTFSFGGFK